MKTAPNQSLQKRRESVASFGIVWCPASLTRNRWAKMKPLGYLMIFSAALVSLGAASPADTIPSEVHAEFGWRDCFQADADFKVDLDLCVYSTGISDHWSEVVYVHARRSKDDLGTAPFFAHPIDSGASARAATVHVVPNPKKDGLHIHLSLQWSEGDVRRRVDEEVVVPYLKEASGVAGSFRYSVAWKEIRPNQPPLPTPGKCPPSNHDQLPGAADL
jgi:hypothetical protein